MHTVGREQKEKQDWDGQRDNWEGTTDREKLV